jgi:plasmid stabilization system protein ParE
MRIVWTTTALRRVADIAAEIEREDPARARELISRIFDKVAMLSEFPEMGRMVPEVGKPHIREIVLEPYRIVYGLKGSQISIRTIRHMRERR